METMHARRAFWSAHVQAWRDSGLTQVAYCQQHALRSKALAYWIRRDRQGREADTLTLLPLTVQTPPPAPPGDLLLQHPSGWQLSLPASVEPAWL
ncbi:IS66 family insertion sequence element accessory protein TnpA, partial [Azotobacter beijerinckii]